MLSTHELKFEPFLGSYYITIRSHSHHLFILFMHFHYLRIPQSANQPLCSLWLYCCYGEKLMSLSIDVFGESTTKCRTEEKSFCSCCSYRRVPGDSCSGGDVQSRLDGEMLPCPVGGKPAHHHTFDSSRDHLRAVLKCYSHTSL